MLIAVDWSAVASLLAEASTKPIIGLDSEGVVRLVNAALERCLGWSRYELVGSNWIERCTPTLARDSARPWLRDALRGALRTHELVALTKTGRRMQLVVDASCVGQDSGRGLVLVVQRTYALSEAPVAASEVEYDVDTTPESFGRVRWSSVQAEQPAPIVGRQCFDLLYGRDRICEQCPARDAGPSPTTLVRRSLADPSAFEVVTASRTQDDAAHVRLLRLSHSVFSQLVQVKITDLAAQAGLSEREQTVLPYLIMGRAVHDIALVLGISARTVKFHQANIIEKLGVDSRVDLMRLIF